MKNTIQKFRDIIVENGLLDYKKWNSFPIDHSVDYSKKDKFCEYIHQQFGSKEINGLYIYDDGNKTLYIGKGESIAHRLIDHFGEAHGKANVDKKDSRIRPA